jgi:hypothetical protein
MSVHSEAVGAAYQEGFDANLDQPNPYTGQGWRTADLREAFERGRQARERANGKTKVHLAGRLVAVQQPGQVLVRLGLRFDGAPEGLGPWWFWTDLLVYARGRKPGEWRRLREQQLGAQGCAPEKTGGN